MELAKFEPVLSADATAYFREQTQLVQVQLTRLDLRRVSDRLRIGPRAFIVLVVTAGLIGLSVATVLAVECPMRRAVYEPIRDAPDRDSYRIEFFVAANTERSPTRLRRASLRRRPKLR